MMHDDNPATSRSTPRSIVRFAAAALTLALAAAALAACSPKDDVTLERYFSYEGRVEAMSDLKTVDELKAAIVESGAAVNAAVSAAAKTGKYWRLLGLRYMDAGLYGEALPALREAIRYYPDMDGLYYAVAVCSAYMAKSQAAGGEGSAEKAREFYATSEASYRRALEFKPDSPRALYGMAVLLAMELNRPAEAEPFLKALLAIETKNSDAAFLLARCQYAVGRLEDAANSYELAAAITGDPVRKAKALELKARVLSELSGGGAP